MKKIDRSKIIICELQKLYPETPIPLNHNGPFTLLIAVVLSAQSTDKKVNELTEELFKVADNPKKMVNLGIDNIYKYIKQLGLSRQKSKNTYNLSKIIIFIFSMKFQFEMMTLSDLLISFLGGIFAGIGISAVIYGSQTLPSSVFGLTSYVQIIFGVLLGWFVFKQLPTLYNYIGILIVVSAGIMLFYFDKKSKNS